MLEIVLIVIALIVIAILVIAAMKPDSFGVNRSIRIAAPADKIFPLLNDLHSHSLWSPFEKDPNMKKVHSGAPLGPGAVYEWEGNREVGKGRIAITNSTAPSKVMLDLDMLKPFKAHNKVEFTVKPEGAGSNVTWAMRGSQPFMAKLVSTFVNCDKMVGSQFEEGLGKLKALAEK